MDDGLTTNTTTLPFMHFKAQFPAPAPGQLEIVEHTSERNGASVSTGLVSFRDRESAPWTVWYDEILTLHATDGAFEIEYDENVYPMEVGDSVWVRAGTTVAYRSRGVSTLFFAVVPADWQSRGMPPKPVWP